MSKKVIILQEDPDIADKDSVYYESDADARKNIHFDNRHHDFEENTGPGEDYPSRERGPGSQTDASPKIGPPPPVQETQGPPHAHTQMGNPGDQRDVQSNTNHPGRVEEAMPDNVESANFYPASGSGVEELTPPGEPASPEKPKEIVDPDDPDELPEENDRIKNPSLMGADLLGKNIDMDAIEGSVSEESPDESSVMGMEEVIDHETPATISQKIIDEHSDEDDASTVYSDFDPSDSTSSSDSTDPSRSDDDDDATPLIQVTDDCECPAHHSNSYTCDEIPSDIKCLMKKCQLTEEQLDFCKSGRLLFFNPLRIKKIGHKGRPPAKPFNMIYDIPLPEGAKDKSVYVFHSFKDRLPGQ